MKDVIVVVALIGAAIGAVLLLELFARAPSIVAGTILIYGGISSIFSIAFFLSFGSITVYPRDIIFGLVIAAAFVRILGLQRLSFPQGALLVIVGLALFSLARGTMVDVAPAVNQFRATFYFLSGALYFVTVKPTRAFLKNLTKLLYATALLILTGTVLLLGEFLTGASLPEAMANPWEGGFRVVKHEQTMILAQASLVALLAWQMRTRERNFERFLPVVLLPAVLLLQWRVVWILFLVGLGILGIRHRRMVSRIIAPIVVTLGIALLLLTRIFTGGDAPSIAESFEGTAETAEGSFLWRVEGWRQLTNDGPQSTSEVFLGAPYGRGLERVIEGTEVTSQAHSFYLDHYLRLGLMGLFVLVLLYGWAVRRLTSVPGPPAVSGLDNPTMMLVLLVTQLINFVTFTPGPEQGLIAGAALSFAAQVYSRDSETIALSPMAPTRDALWSVSGGLDARQV